MAEQLMKELADGTAAFEWVSQKQETHAASLFAGRRKESDACFARIGSLQTGTPPFAKKLEHYTIHKVKGDGRCMFRALAIGMAYNDGFNLSSNEEQKQADDLRMTVMDALCSSEKERRKFEVALIAITLDESINRYCGRIRYADFWGGESELLVLSQMYKQPIVVYIPEHETKRSGSKWGSGFIPIAEYGLEFMKATKEQDACRPLRRTNHNRKIMCLKCFVTNAISYELAKGLNVTRVESIEWHSNVKGASYVGTHINKAAQRSTV